MSRLAVIGAGYVGLVNAACLAEIGHDVALVDVDRSKVERLRGGSVDILEPGLEELVRANVSNGRLLATADYEEAIPAAEYVMTAVSTPVGEDGLHDLRALWGAVDSLAPLMSSGATLVLLSTVPPGTTDAAEARLRAAGREDVFAAVQPEFFQEGRAVQDAWSPPRVIVGCRDRARGAAIAQLWRREDVPLLLTDPANAELAKLASNAYLAARISFINEVADHAARVGADITEVAHAMGLDPRIGSRYLSAGLGFGGSCLPKDVQGLSSQMRAMGGEPRMLDAAFAVNQARPEAVIRGLGEHLGSLEGKTVAVLGIAFKPGTSDRRESAAITLARRLASTGARVRATDPTVGPDEAGAVAAEIGGGIEVTDLTAATEGADAVVLATEWPEFVDLDWPRLAQRLAGQVVVDARNVLDREALHNAGLTYVGLGR